MAVKRIRFIVTGDLERAAIVRSLRRSFPETTWDGDPVEWRRPQKLHGATTHRVDREKPPTNPMRQLARAALAELQHGADGIPADLVVVIDDIELHNLDQPAAICDRFRAAMHAELDARGHSADVEARLRTRLREGCSLHLVPPMIESYLFGDRAALIRAGCDPAVEPRLAHPDVERFESVDQAWRSYWEKANADRHAEPQPMPWWREQCHPKHYLEHLVDRSDGIYDEVPDGAEAFAALSWRSLPPDACSLAFARALFEDLALFFGVANPLGPGEACPLTWPDKRTNRRTLLLRNM